MKFLTLCFNYEEERDVWESQQKFLWDLPTVDLFARLCEFADFADQPFESFVDQQGLSSQIKSFVLYSLADPVNDVSTLQVAISTLP